MVAAWSPSVVVFTTLTHQVSRKLRRSFSLPWLVKRSRVHLTSAAVKGFPSCHLTPSRNLKVSSVPSSLHAQLSARSGTIDFKLFCFTLGSNITRLLNTPMIGATIEIVPSSRIDMFPGLSRCQTRNVPPCFCACAGPASSKLANRSTIVSAAHPTFFTFPPTAGPGLPPNNREARSPSIRNQPSIGPMRAWAPWQHRVMSLESLAQTEVGLRNGLRHPRESAGPGQAVQP